MCSTATDAPWGTPPSHAVPRFFHHTLDSITIFTIIVHYFLLRAATSESRGALDSTKPPALSNVGVLIRDLQANRSTTF